MTGGRGVLFAFYDGFGAAISRKLRRPFVLFFKMEWVYVVLNMKIVIFFVLILVELCVCVWEWLLYANCVGGGCLNLNNYVADFA